jgi:propanol-preferring alcohol dehydrogenase
MRAARLVSAGTPLVVGEVPEPTAGPGQVVLEVEACAVCRTDLHLRDGEIADGGLPRILGHQIVGRDPSGRRVGVMWLGWACGVCRWCTSGRENLCPSARFTGKDLDGGFAERVAVHADFCLALPEGPPAPALAPLLCGGAIGYRALRLAGDGVESVGMYGFGSAAHLVAQVAQRRGQRVFAFTREAGDEPARLAASLGVEWVGPSSSPPPERLDAALIFAAAGGLVPAALRALDPGGTVVCAGIHMSDIPGFPYADLWEERSVRSVANVTRADGRELLELVGDDPLDARVSIYPLEQAEQALADLRAGAFSGSAVLVP